jgi:hypothetical protein
MTELGSSTAAELTCARHSGVRGRAERAAQHTTKPHRVVGADDQRDVGAREVLVDLGRSATVSVLQSRCACKSAEADLFHFQHAVVRHTRLRQQHVQLAGHAACREESQQRGAQAVNGRRNAARSGVKDAPATGWMPKRTFTPCSRRRATMSATGYCARATANAPARQPNAPGTAHGAARRRTSEAVAGRNDDALRVDEHVCHALKVRLHVRELLHRAGGGGGGRGDLVAAQNDVAKRAVLRQASPVSAPAAAAGAAQPAPHHSLAHDVGQDAARGANERAHHSQQVAVQHESFGD